MTATQSRNLAWLNFVRTCCGLPLHTSKWVAEPVAEAAEALTRYPPFAVGLDSVKLEVRPIAYASAEVSQALCLQTRHTRMHTHYCAYAV